MLETILITAGVSFVVGWFSRNHVQNITNAAISAVNAATTIHVNPSIDAAVKSAGDEVVKGVESVAGKVV